MLPDLPVLCSWLEGDPNQIKIRGCNDTMLDLDTNTNNMSNSHVCHVIDDMKQT